MKETQEKTEKNLKFSVSMCVYGGDNPVWFREAVESILNQTVPPSEIVLVVDGPVSNELDAVIKGFENQPQFHVIRLIQNQGHGNARRKGFAACKNDLIALMDADDVSLPNRFEKQIKKFEEDDEVSVVGGNISEFIGEQGNIIGYRLVPETNAEIKKYLKKRCPMNQMTVMFKKQEVEQVGGYIDWYCDEDYYLWLRMHLAGKKFCNLNEVLVNVRVGEDMYHRRGGWKYFKSEAKLQGWMLKQGIIGFCRYVINIMERFIVQVLLPNRLRGWVFKKFARKANKE